MAKLQIRTDANAIIISKNIPDPIITYAQEVFGGANATETANAVVGWLWGQLRAHVRNHVGAAAGFAQEPLAHAAKQAKEDEFDVAVP